MVDNIRLVLLSFFASIGFGIVFRIKGRELLLAGIGGALTRIVLLILLQLAWPRVVYMTLAAWFASVYGEVLATKLKYPSTYFIYPSIVPLIPGDLFFYMMIGLLEGNLEAFVENGLSCLLALVGMSIGFVISSTFMHYVRKIRYLRRIRRSLL